MFKESVLKVERERGREAGKSGSKVTLEGVNCLVGRVCPVVVGGDKLEVDVFFCRGSV